MPFSNPAQMTPQMLMRLRQAQASAGKAVPLYPPSLARMNAAAPPAPPVQPRQMQAGQNGQMWGRKNPPLPPAMRRGPRDNIREMISDSMMRKSAGDYGINQYASPGGFNQTPNDRTNRSIRQLYADWNRLPGFEGMTSVPDIPSSPPPAPPADPGTGQAANGGTGPASNFDAEQIRNLIAQYRGGLGPMSNFDAGQIQQMVEGLRRGGWPSVQRTEI